MSEAEKDAEIARLRERCALLDSFLGECIRHHYYDDTKVSQTWQAATLSHRHNFSNRVGLVAVYLTVC